MENSVPQVIYYKIITYFHFPAICELSLSLLKHFIHLFPIIKSLIISMLELNKKDCRDDKPFRDPKKYLQQRNKAEEFIYFDNGMTLRPE